VVGSKHYLDAPPSLGGKPGLRLWKITILMLFSLTALRLAAREKDANQYGMGLIVNIPFPESEVTQVVQDVIQNGIIRGTKEYNKDEYIAGAIATPSTSAFPEWKEGGKVFYKVRKEALDPRNFKNSGDLGTIAVRYVVQPQGDKNTILRIDAVFVEDFRHGVHPSDGSVESSEYKDIHDHLDAMELVKKETEEALRQKQEYLARQNFGLSGGSGVAATPSPAVPSTTMAEKTMTATTRPDSPVAQSKVVPSKNDNLATGSVAPNQQSKLIPPPSFTTSPSPAPQSSSSASSPKYESSYGDNGESLQQHVADLRRDVERIVKQPGAALQSAPFHTATTLRSLEPGAEVLILVSTTYWYGVETHDGQHGWIRRDQLDFLP
jgi:hypothetical protein